VHDGVGTEPAVPPRVEGGVPHRAEARRVTSSGLADLAARQAEAIAALDRALETRLEALDRAFAVRRRTLEALVDTAEGRIGDLVDDAVVDLRRSATGERRVLKEAVAAELAAVEALVAGYREQVRAHALEQHEAFGDLARRVAELELAIDALAGRDAGPDTELDPGPDAGQGVRARPS